MKKSKDVAVKVEKRDKKAEKKEKKEEAKKVKEPVVSSSSSESESESEAEVAKPVVKKQESDSSSSSESEASDSSSESEAEAKPAKVEAKKQDSSDSSSSDSESEDEKPAAKAAKESDSSSSEDSSSSSSSDEDEDMAEAEPAKNSKKRSAEDAEEEPASKMQKSEESSTIFVGNLSWSVTEDSLKEIFGECGTIIGARVATEAATGRSRGFGYVDFSNAEEAQAALKLGGQDLMGRAMNVDISTSKPKNDGANGRKEAPKSAPDVNLFIGNLSFKSSEDSLAEIFGEYGTVVQVRLPTDRETGRMKGFGYVEMGSIDEAKAALDALNGQDVDGRSIRIDYSGARAQNNNSFGGGRGNSRGGFGGRGNSRGGFGGRGGQRGGFGGRGNSRGGFGGRGNSRGGFGGRGNSRGGFNTPKPFAGQKTVFNE